MSELEKQSLKSKASKKASKNPVNNEDDQEQLIESGIKLNQQN
jgi:hypothetical protein